MWIGNNLRIESLMFDALFLVFFFLVLKEGRKILGREKASIFLWGSLLWTTVVENLMVINGAYDYYAYTDYYCAGGRAINGFNGWSIMVLFVPLTVSMGWFIFSLPAFVISNRLLEGKNIWLKSAFAAVMLVSLDMLMDPLAVVNEWWRWTVPGYYYKGVSIGNYIGWFFMLFYFAVIYERTVIEESGFRWLAPLERMIFRTDTMSLAKTDTAKISRVMYFRTAVFIPIMVITTLLFAAIPKKIGYNRFAPFNSVFPKNYDERFPASMGPAGAAPVILEEKDIRKIKGPRCSTPTGKPELENPGKGGVQ